MSKLIELVRQEEYYRPGVWKIYYRVEGVAYSFEGKIHDGPDEIKFSGKDAEGRSLTVFHSMVLDLVDLSVAIENAPR